MDRQTTHPMQRQNFYLLAFCFLFSIQFINGEVFRLSNLFETKVLENDRFPMD